MTSNQGTQKVFAFQRSAMLVGTPTAKVVYTNFTPPSGGGFFCPMPGDNDGNGGLAPAGTPCPIFTYSDNAWGGGATDAIKVYTMAVNWLPVAPTATITLAATLNTSAFDASYDPSWDDISQPGTTQKLDGIGGVIQFRAQWRNWTTYRTTVLNWPVKISATQRSIMWAEIRQDPGTGVWSIYQRSIYAPDTKSRWMGSIAMDDNGGIGLCYARASTTAGDYMGLYYAGRKTCDPLNTLPVTEQVAIAGTGSQTGGVNRDGDYAQTSLDPDGITFWHTGEYMGGPTGGSAARTRIYSFQLPTCAPIVPVANFSGTPTTICAGSSVTFTDLSTNTPTSWAWTFAGGTPATSTLQNPVIVYNTAGTYNVTLTATNSAGSSTPLPSYGITQNTMRRAQDGFVLKNNGIIGTQGSTTVASNNYWDMSAAGAPNFTNSEIFTDNTGGAPSNANVFSKLYMNNIPTGTNATMPQTSPAFLPPGLSLSNTGIVNQYTFGTGLNVTSSIPTACSGTPPPAFAIGTMTPAEIASQATFLKTVEEDSTLLSVYNNETRWQRKKYVFDEVDDNPAYTVNPTLSSFYAAHAGSTFDKFTRVDKKIALGQYALANAINNSVTPTNIIESNQQEVNTQILQPLLAPTYIYSSADVSTLKGIAIQCPLEGGNGVYQARILLMNIANDVIEFVDNCDKEAPRSMDITPQINGNEAISAYKLYPNPNDGNMMFEYSLPETSSGMLILYDVTGRFVNSYKLTEGENNILKISENELQNGIYFYNVIIDNKVKAQKKIVIVK